MAASLHSQQVVKLRRFLVISYVLLAAASVASAFFLSWNELPGVPWFLGTGVAFGLWASVIATNNRIAANDLLGIAKAVGPRSLSETTETVPRAHQQ